MAILDKVLGVGEAVRDKLKETFGEPDTSGLDDDDGGDGNGNGDGDASAEGASALDPPAAYAALGLAEGATLADVREAYRAMARYHHPAAVRDGVDSEAQRTLDRLLEALELLEEQLVPLTASGAGAGGGGSGVTGRASRPPARRKRATARTR